MKITFQNYFREKKSAKSLKMDLEKFTKSLRKF